jgi:mono/diheme cytochrome c family protein
MGLHCEDTDLPDALSMVSRVAKHTCRGRQGWLPLMGTLLMVCGLTTGLARVLTAAEVDYTRDVKPLLQQHCVGCHGAKRQRGDLRLDSRAALLKGGSRGPAVVAGKAAESLLIQAVIQDDPEIAMPPEGDPLSSAEVQVLRDWIDQGALGPADEATARKEIPWSFRPVQRPNLPAAAASIDELLEAQRARQDLASLGFSAEADRVTQIRRLYLVMHGLPPTPAEVQEFVADTAPGAYERLVDRVLASPRYGERWGRHWLDIARFAESNGFETNRVRPNAWPYRDYVIEAFNSDKPYDQFVREQVAGDALRADAGTGFLVAGAYDLVKSPDVNLTLMQRQDELADIINTTGTAFLGLTLGCARCHDHKFDPVSQRDYYALQGVFAGVNFAPRPLPRARTAESDREVACKSRFKSGKNGWQCCGRGRPGRPIQRANFVPP